MGTPLKAFICGVVKVHGGKEREPSNGHEKKGEAVNTVKAIETKKRSNLRTQHSESKEAEGLSVTFSQEQFI